MSERMTATQDEERWADVPDLPGYQVSSIGRARSIDRVVVAKDGRTWTQPGKLLKVQRRSGYVTFMTTGKTHLMNRAVLKAFVGMPPSPTSHACHNNGTKTDNAPTNLRWDTPKGNEADKQTHGTVQRGERHYAAKLTSEQVASIKLDSRMHKVIAAEYGVSRSHISSIKSWCFRKHG